MNVQYQYKPLVDGWFNLRVSRRRWLLPDVVYVDGMVLGEWVLNDIYPRIFSVVSHLQDYRLEVRLVVRDYDVNVDPPINRKRLWQPVWSSEGNFYAIRFHSEGWVAEWMERYGLIERTKVDLQPDGRSGRLMLSIRSRTALASGRSCRGLFDATKFDAVEHHHKLKDI